jgi:outer membrane protein assembly factor BamB
VGREGQVFCLDAATGKVVWQKNVVTDGGAKIPEWGIASSAVIDGNLLYVNAGAGGIALDKATGREVWNGGSGAAGYASPVVFNSPAGKCVALFSAKELVVADAATGKKKATYPWVTSYDVNGADPLVDGDRIFLTSGYDRGCTMLKFNGRSLEKVWENKNIRSHFTSPVMLGGALYGVDGQAGSKAQLTCLDPVTGEVKWRGATGFGGMMVAGGKFLVLNDSGFLVAAEAGPAAYKEIARGKVVDGKPWTMPVLANGVVYCRNEKGDLAAVDVSK